jgi:hypothetical protein
MINESGVLEGYIEKTPHYAKDKRGVRYLNIRMKHINAIGEDEHYLVVLRNHIADLWRMQLEKGMRALFIGHLEMRKWKTSDNKEHETIIFAAHDVRVVLELQKASG